MRRWVAILACALAAVLLGGCGGLPDGVDGDLTGGWAAMPAAQQFRPEAGACHGVLDSSGAAEGYEPVPCSGPHVAETVAVADLTGAESLTSAVAATDRAYAECSKRVTAFLGADWRTGWVITQPVLPGKGAWSGGARWVRCDVAETSPVDASIVRRASSMRGALKSGGTLRMGCANPKITGDRVTEMHPVACARSHTSEFAGLFTSSRKTSAEITSKELEKGCDATIAKFAAIPNDSSVANRVGWLGFPPDRTAWAMGDRAVRCFLWLDGGKMTGSYRNAGKGKLPINYVSR